MWLYRGVPGIKPIGNPIIVRKWPNSAVIAIGLGRQLSGGKLPPFAAWNQFLPISMPIVAMVAADLLDMAVLRLTLAPSQHHSPVGQEYGRTIPSPDEPNAPRSC